MAFVEAICLSVMGTSDDILVRVSFEVSVDGSEGDRREKGWGVERFAKGNNIVKIREESIHKGLVRIETSASPTHVTTDNIFPAWNTLQL